MKKYTLFIDESGVSNLNHPGKTFVLSTVVVSKDDLSIVEGYLRLIKRNFLKNDYKNIHTTDLFERPYTKYRQLLRPRDRGNAFLQSLQDTIKILPIQSGIYYANKQALSTLLKYRPAPKKLIPNVNTDLPYELCVKQALIDFVVFLKKNRAFGEIMLESRRFHDQLFVKYFDDIRKEYSVNRIRNPFYKEVNNLVHKLSITTKGDVNIGLELADIGAYTTYRNLMGDPMHRMKTDISFSKSLNKTFREKSYIKNRNGTKVIEVRLASLQFVKPSKQF